MKIYLKEIDDTNRDAVIALKVGIDQVKFVASNRNSLTDAGEAAEVARPFAIYADDELVGFTMFAFDNEEYPEDSCWLWRLMIDISKQRQGYGSAAMGEIIEYFKANGAEQIVLSINEENNAARSFFRKHGFKESGEMNEGETVFRFYFDETDAPDDEDEDENYDGLFDELLGTTE